MGGPARPQGIPDRCHDRVLADDVLEPLGSPAPVQGLVRWAFAHWIPGSGRGDWQK